MAETDPYRDLHRRLLAGERDAPERIATACAPRLQRLLRRRHLALPPEGVADAANDALLDYFAHPGRYDPDRLPLLKWLTLIADRKLVDRYRRHARETTRLEFVGGPVELAAAAAKHTVEGPADLSDPDLLPPELEAWLRETLPDPADRAFLRLMSEGERSTDAFAALLALDAKTAMTGKERAAEVKRSRDRILKRLQRRRGELWEKWGYGDA